MNKFKVGDMLEGTDKRHESWDCKFIVEVAAVNDNECRVRFLSWTSSNPNNQWDDRDENHLFWYPSSFFQYAKSYTYASRLFFGD